MNSIEGLADNVICLFEVQAMRLEAVATAVREASITDNGLFLMYGDGTFVPPSSYSGITEYMTQPMDAFLQKTLFNDGNNTRALRALELLVAATGKHTRLGLLRTQLNDMNNSLKKSMEGIMQSTGKAPSQHCTAEAITLMRGAKICAEIADQAEMVKRCVVVIHNLKVGAVMVVAGASVALLASYLIGRLHSFTINRHPIFDTNDANNAGHSLRTEPISL
ncbi:MAG: hypothetical protein HYT77_10740 [Deltaproteobacteria bacterium]|nr:hypothetical protein [Deltaproteobacteria bacterium]